MDDDGPDPFADLRPVEKLYKTSQVNHDGSVHQVTPDAPKEEPEPPSRNTKHENRTRFDLSVLRRFLAMMMLLSMFAGAVGGVTVAVDLRFLLG